MAIKGKGKTRQRAPARAPKRAPVEVPVPLPQRRWVQVTTAFVLGAGLVWFLIWLTNGIRQGRMEDRVAAESVEKRRAVQSWQALVDSQLATVGTLGPSGVPPTVAAELDQAIQAIGDGEGEEIVGTLEDLETRLEAAADELDAFELAPAIRDKGFSSGETNALTNSQSLLTSALRQYAVAASLAQLAAGADGQTQRGVIDDARATQEQAATILQQAWSELGLGLKAAGLELTGTDPSAGLGTSGIPGLGG